jgi:hypothetical protein
LSSRHLLSKVWVLTVALYHWQWEDQCRLLCLLPRVSIDALDLNKLACLRYSLISTSSAWRWVDWVSLHQDFASNLMDFSQVVPNFRWKACWLGDSEWCFWCETFASYNISKIWQIKLLINFLKAVIHHWSMNFLLYLRIILEGNYVLLSIHLFLKAAAQIHFLLELFEDFDPRWRWFFESKE